MPCNAPFGGSPAEAAEKAEADYCVDENVRRRPGRPAIGSAPRAWSSDQECAAKLLEVRLTGSAGRSRRIPTLSARPRLGDREDAERENRCCDGGECKRRRNAVAATEGVLAHQRAILAQRTNEGEQDQKQHCIQGL